LPKGKPQKSWRTLLILEYAPSSQSKAGLGFQRGFMPSLALPNAAQFFSRIANTTDKTLKVAARGEANPLINLKGSN
jgi:hypothetical protein